MTPTASSGAAGAIVDRGGDLFDNPGTWLVIVLLTLLTAISLIGLAFIYYGDSVAVPAWDERAVPAVTTS